MSFYQSSRTGMPNHAASQSTAPEVNFPQELTTLSSHSGLSDVFAVMMQELSDLFEQLSACDAEFEQISKHCHPRKSRSSSLRENEYMEFLAKKGNFLEGITAAIEKIKSSPEIPKAKVHSYQKFAELYKERFDSIRRDVELLIEELKISKEECERVEEQIEDLRKLKENEETTNEDKIVTRLFNDGKADLNTILSIVYPENIKREFASAMAELTEAFMKNEDEEDQYVELSPVNLQNPGLISMMNGHVIVSDPSNPLKYRLNMAE